MIELQMRFVHIRDSTSRSCHPNYGWTRQRVTLMQFKLGLNVIQYFCNIHTAHTRLSSNARKINSHTTCYRLLIHY